MPTALELMIAVTGTLSDLADIREQVREFTVRCGLSPEAVDEVELAVDEAVTNVIKHAYKPGQSPRLEVRGIVKPGQVVITVRDFGRKYTPKPVTAADVKKVLARHQTHGLGRFIIKKNMNGVRYKSVTGKYNETVMVKKIK